MKITYIILNKNKQVLLKTLNFSMQNMICIRLKLLKKKKKLKECQN